MNCPKCKTEMRCVGDQDECYWCERCGAVGDYVDVDCPHVSEETDAVIKAIPYCGGCPNEEVIRETLESDQAPSYGLASGLEPLFKLWPQLSPESRAVLYGAYRALDKLNDEFTAYRMGDEL